MPLTKSYEKLLPIIRDLPDFRWPGPTRSHPSERDNNKRCDYHKDHGHNTETCRNLHYMVEDLLKAGHLKQYIRTAPKVWWYDWALEHCLVMSSNPTKATLPRPILSVMPPSGTVRWYGWAPEHCLVMSSNPIEATLPPTHSGCDANVWHSSVVRLGTRALPCHEFKSYKGHSAPGPFRL
ncbi:hypothetical protein CK203_035670 [Vitis vinifera]|uniref:Uncharacterized protein n=1 Tax=Vitis vinifera TaxID=29760 RepID=A0A438ICJ6_VITVI|nr:hypothetical protein CK203_035670 [Vitis vinifera]